MRAFGAEKGVLQDSAKRPVAHALKSPELSWRVLAKHFKSWVGSQGVWSACAQFSDGLMVRSQGGVIGLNVISPGSLGLCAQGLK